MATLKEKLQNDTKEAMRAKDDLRLSVLRMLSSAIKNREIEKRAKGNVEELSDEEVFAVIRSELKKRRDAVEQFLKGGREDLAVKETKEIGVLEEYVPAELTDEEVEVIVKEVIQEIGNVTAKDFGGIMGQVMRRVKGRASGDRVSLAVKKELEGK